MGSQNLQGELWGKKPEDWAKIQEGTGITGYEHALKILDIKPNDKLLDVGCGSGIFSDLAFIKGAIVTGIDASGPLIDQAKQRNKSIQFSVGEMEDLQFAENTFDIVCGFNSFQYAADIKNALSESKRVLKEKGKLVVMIWGNKEDCEAGSALKAIGRMLPPPPPNAGGPFALSENQLLENTIKEVGFKILNNSDVESVWDYPNLEIALKGLLSAGPSAKAIANSGFQKVKDEIAESMKPYTNENGRIVYNNMWRVVVCEN